MISVCTCTHNPEPRRLARCLESLRRLSPPADGVEFLVVDNASEVRLSETSLGRFPAPMRLIREERLGLTAARQRAYQEARGGILVFVDDDNVLDPDYLHQVRRFFDAHPRAGVIGARIFGEFEIPPPTWCDLSLQDCLAVRDMGAAELLYDNVPTPLGAGMAVRREVFDAALQRRFLLGDRCGTALSSGGDSELCYRARLMGWELWHAPELRLQHLIDGRRLTLDYFDRLFLAMGRDRPLLELYWHPPRPWRRLILLRRAFQGWRLSSSATPPDLHPPADGVEARRRFEWHFQRGALEALWKLAWGPCVWTEIETFRRAGDGGASPPRT